jgi:hypothetical protein
VGPRAYEDVDARTECDDPGSLLRHSFPPPESSVG